MNMAFDILVSTDTLAAHLQDPNWLIFDCRFDLDDLDLGFSQYLAGHIPGAVYVHLNEDLSAKTTPHTGRHPLPDPDTFAKKCAAWGIQPDKQVVVYDAAGGSFADRMWWMLRAIGHLAVAVLDGSYPKWLAENRPITQGIEHPRPVEGNLAGISFDPQMLVNADAVQQVLNNSAYLLIDARAAERFNGLNETRDPIAGHIPGAVNRYYGLDLNPDGTFKSSQELQSEFKVLLGGVLPENVILYCGSGVTSCHLLVAMEAAGMKGARIYAGSWSEWCRNPDRPRFH
jgi:thiosulfate/3-mercaptopyruvate sulfurtransferase